MVDMVAEDSAYRGGIASSARRFEYRGELGGGAQGHVLLVEDRERGLEVALKAVPATARATMVRECARLAALAHPALPRVFDIGVLDEAVGPVAAGTPYFTTEVIRGRALAAAAPVDAATAWAIAVDIAGALAAIHAAGLVHCDVAPANVLLTGVGPAIRAHLIDLGLASTVAADRAARGTPAFLAPEALAGHATPAVDLYGLGACLYFALRGRPPVDGEGPALLEAVLRAPRPRLTDGEAGGLAELVARLTDRAPEARPRDAAAAWALAAAARAALPPDQAPPARPPPPAQPGRGLLEDWPSAAAAIDGVAARAAAARAGGVGPVAIVIGPPGAGARAVVERAALRDQLAAAARGEVGLALRLGRLEALAPAALPDSADDHRGRALATAVLAAAAADAGTFTVIDATDDERAAAIVAAAAAVVGPGAVAVAIEGAEVAATTDAWHLAPVAPAVLGGLIGGALPGPPSASWLAALAEAARGLPPVAHAIVAALAADGGDPRDRDPGTAAAAGALTARSLVGAPPEVAAVALALATWREPVDDERLAATAAVDAAALAEALGWLADRGLTRRTSAGDEVPPAVAAALLAAVPAADRRAAAAAVVRVARAAGLPAARYAHALVDAGAAVAERVAAATAALERGAPALALALCGDLDDDGAALVAARAALVRGDYRRALAALDRGFAEPRDARSAQLLAARARQRAGDLAGAEAALIALRAAAPDDPEVLGPWARLAVARGRYRDAIAALEALGPVPADAAGGLCAEVRATAHLYLGERAPAAAHAATALAIAVSRGDPAMRGRALILHGMAAQADDDLAGAAEHYRAAAAAARAGGDGHTAAIAEQNQAAALAERGLHGPALPALSAAAAELTALGRVAELGAVEANRAVSLLALGQLASATQAAAAARAHADAAGVPVARFYAALVDGDIARRHGDRAAAARAYRAAWDLGVAAELPDRGHAQRNLAEVVDGDAAVAAVATAAALDRDDSDRAYTLLARGRLAARGLGDEPPGPLADALAELADAAERGGRLDRRWRARHLAALARARAGDPTRAAAELRQARAELEAVMRLTPEAWRATAMLDPDARALTAAAPPAAPTPSASSAPTAATATELARLRRLLGLARRLTAETELPRLLDEVLDTALELTQAERGFIVLRGIDDAPDHLEIAASRGFTQDHLSAGTISRSVAHRAIASGEPVITVDAGHDQRFDGAASVAALRLRSVIAVPLFARGQVLGCLYVDHRVRVGAFDDAAADGLVELAAIAAVAIATARLIGAARDDAAAIAALNARLAAEIADRDAELAVVRAAAPSRPRRAGFDALVGDSPELAAALAVVERAALVALPVAIVGESGTGKELCARAVHQAGPRRDRPFVAVNCGALPEPLLETELFGHERGAFTGADRERKGLFEIADGGTLFLDEIADTSPAMQAKLLRVVQDGEVRRVGGDRSRRVDVRLVCASQVPLAELVAAGRFRDDLRYRLDVIAVTMPPLRARPGDLPALIAHLLARIAGDRPPPRLSRDAARALARYPWPGNVRELENALARAVALGSDPITVDDLPEAIRTPSAPAPRPTAAGDLSLRPAVDALERAYVEAALTRARGNQSAAARLLGLSRFGLQKKLARLGLTARR
jgi:serine/threonine-protein kinase PknK